MRILLTNDDGIYAPGIAALKAELAALGEVTVVAPEAERSAAGHSITLDRPLRVHDVYVGEVFLGYACDGSPADCVKLGVKEVLQTAPDLVVSGINLGANVGINVLYSGTVAAALEGAILSVTSVAVSLESSKKPDFTPAANIAREVIVQILERRPPTGSLFNLNVPARPCADIKGVVVAPQSTVSYDDGFEVRTDPRGAKYFWMTGELDRREVSPDTDTALLADGYVTLTPLTYDLTDRRLLAQAAAWRIDITNAMRAGRNHGGVK